MIVGGAWPLLVRGLNRLPYRVNEQDQRPYFAYGDFQR